MGIVSVRWHPLLQLPGGSWAGLGGEEYERIWVGSDKEARRELDLAKPVGLLPLLEQPFSVVQAELDELSGRGFERFSYQLRECLEAVPDVAISMESPYWTERAIEWLDARSSQTSSANQLESIATSSWASQAVRHKALRLLRRSGRTAS